MCGAESARHRAAPSAVRRSADTCRKRLLFPGSLCCLRGRRHGPARARSRPSLLPERLLDAMGKKDKTADVGAAQAVRFASRRRGVPA